MQLRTPERLRVHYELEKTLANKLKNALVHERSALYSQVYDQLFREIYDHPQLTNKENAQQRVRTISWQLGLLKRFLTQATVVMEIGAGDCALSCAMAPRVKKVYAVDVSAEIAKGVVFAENTQLLILQNGVDIPLEPAMVTLAYSYQLMEHLHPEDAIAQLQEVYRVLQPGGHYICVTPNKFTGPHDISRYFDDMAMGFHLKEYTLTELESLFRSVGFTHFVFYAGGKGIFVRLPLFLVRLCEKIIACMSLALRKKLCRNVFARAFLGITLVARK